MRSWRSTSIGALACGALLLWASVASAAPAPSWRIESLSNTNATPGLTHSYYVEFTNVSTKVVKGTPVQVEFQGKLPQGMTVVDVVGVRGMANVAWDCSGSIGRTVKCTSSAPEFLPRLLVDTPETLALFRVDAKLSPLMPEGTATASFDVSGGSLAGGGSLAADSTVDPTTIATGPAPFGIDAFDAPITGPDGALYTQAGGHPYQITTQIEMNTHAEPLKHLEDLTPSEAPKDIYADLPAGLVGNAGDIGQCTMEELRNAASLFYEPAPLCPSDSQVGVVTLRHNGHGEWPDHWGPFELFNMVPPSGAPARFAFDIRGVVVVLDAHLAHDGEYVLTVGGKDLSQSITLAGTELTLWGVPADPGHDSERGCPGNRKPPAGPSCAVGSTPAPFLRMPTSCTAPGEGFTWTLHADSWAHPGREEAEGLPDLSDPHWDSLGVESHETPGYPASPLDPSTPWGEVKGTDGCQDVPVKAKLTAKPTALETETSSGLDVHVEVPDPGLENPTGISSSDLKAVKVALPQGITINPSQAEGLGVCSPIQYESTELSFHPSGAGCPSDSKIGTVEVHTPLLAETIPGDVYVAKPYDNPFDSLLAIYIVLEEPQRGILVKLPGEVRTNEASGQIEAEFKDLPQLPFSTFDFHFREGARAPLVTPPACGVYTTVATITPWSDPAHPVTSSSTFQVTKGIGGGPCPPDGIPPFSPGFSAGSINSSAGAHSPFNMRLTRNDGEQDMARFSSILPPGEIGSLAGVSKCPEAAVASAKAKGGIEEREHPSCPANSEIGRSIVGAGVGSVLTYVPGKIYLGGPFHGDPLSVIAITPAVAGPFDIGTVVVHLALTLNPATAEVEVDGSASDPIPHILKGIPAKLRDLRVYVDRPNFLLNPTSCDPSRAKATLFGGGANPFNSADDVPVSLATRYQASNCASLGFKPALALTLKGGTRRGGHPGLAAIYRPRRGDANIKSLTVTLPRSAFLDQAHIRTICTRVQFAAKSCPPASQYGYIKAFTPLLEEPLAGPVYLRSSNHKLPDLVFDLHGLVDIEVDVRIDSFHGGIRATLESAPDAPLSKVIVKMQGAKKGLIVNSRDICGSTNRADVEFEGQNGKTADAMPEMKAECGGARKHRHKRNSR